MSALGSNSSGVVRGNKIDSSRRPLRANKSNEASGVDRRALKLIAKPSTKNEAYSALLITRYTFS